MEVDDQLKHSEFDILVDILLKSSAKCPSNILDTDPHPSDLTLALLSEAVYTEKTTQETAVDYENRLDLPKGWRLLGTGSNSSLKNGYFGAAYVNTTWQQVVLAHRGTLLSNPGAVFTDVVGICATKYTQCMNSAVTFMEFIRQLIFSVNTYHGRSYNLIITGHSLGGWLAQITAFTVMCVKMSDGLLMRNDSGGVHAKTVVFDSPGVKDMLEKILDDYYLRLGSKILDKLDITIYVSAPNPVNTHGAHIGMVYRVLTDVSKFDWKAKNTLLFYSNKTHAMRNFVNAFKNNSDIIEVLDWPKNINELNLLFGKDALNATNNYHTDFEEETYDLYLSEQTKRYNSDKRIMCKCNFKAFSDDELQILNRIMIIQGQVDINVINKFVSNNNLQLKNEKLFPDFKIDLSNRTVSCESKQLLEKLRKRLKQLMRWLGSEFIKAVEEQIDSFPLDVDLFYRVEGQSFLDSIPKSTLNFTDSIGFQDFLLSETARVFYIVTQDGAFEMTRLHNIFFQIKEKVHTSAPNNEYTGENNFTFLDWSRLQKLYKIGSPIDQNNLMMVDCSSPSALISEIFTYINNYLQCSSPKLKKLVFISSYKIDNFNSSDKLKSFKADRKINLIDLSSESKNRILQKHSFIITGNKGYSFQEFLGENCSILEINRFLNSECFQNIVTNEDYVIYIKDLRPRFSDLQMLVFKTNIKTSIEYISSCINLPNTLVVISGLSREELDTEASWEQLKGKEIILAEEDVELFFKNICNKYQHKSIYLLDVSGGELYCKQIFNTDFYLPRKFLHRARFDLQKFAKTKLIDDLLVYIEPFSGSIGKSKESVLLSEYHVPMVSTKEEEINFIQKNFNKNIHFVRFEKTKSERFELEWQYSHGSVENVRFCICMDSCEPIDELSLSQTDRNLVIISDDPGMGKSTSLGCLSRHIVSSWVIYIELKHFQEHIDLLPEEFTASNVANFLLSKYCSADGSLPHGLLENLLHSKKCSKRVVLMFDGFDELDDYNENTKSSKEKLLRLFVFLVNKPTVQIFLTSRKYLKELLEGKLSHFSTPFVMINTQEQQQFLFMFWRSCLYLELEKYGGDEERRLKEYAKKLIEEAKHVLGQDMDCFMGVPLQLRLLAEVFRPQRDMLVQSPEILYEKINIISAPNLYKRFINLKYEIYLQEKTLLSKMMKKLAITEHLESVTKMHGELGFKTFFNNFFDQNFGAVTEEWLIQLNRYGLVHSKINGEFQFIHRTYAEYCCGQMVVQWLNQGDSHFGYPLVKEILLPQILLHPDSKIIRMFINEELNEITMTATALKLNAQHITKLWFEDNSRFSNQEHQTVLHIAVQERNKNIAAFLLSGLNVENMQEEFVSFITQFDIYNNTALNIVDTPTTYKIGGNHLSLNGITRNILKGIQTCCYDTKEKVFFACLFNRDISNCFVSTYVRESGDLNHGDTLKVFDRVKEVELEMNPFIDAVLENNVMLAREIFLNRLKNNVERYCCLLMKWKNHRLKSVLHLAAQFGHHNIVELFAEQTSVAFAVLLAQRDDNMQTPLHTAAMCGHLEIVKYFNKRGADINTRCELGKTALVYAVCAEDIPCVKYLIKSSADINSVGDDGKTALHESAYKGCLPIVELLIENGANINSTDKIGPTVLNCAAQRGHLSVVEYLVKSGANIKSIDKDGASALHYAAREGHFPVVEYLVQSDAFVNSVDNIDRSALYYAAQQGHLLIVEYLLKNGCDIMSVDSFGSTALHVAAEENNLPVVECLVRNSASINATNNDGTTALQAAAEEGNFAIVECLVKSGANINSVDNDGCTAIHSAAEKGNLAIVECLVKSGADINIFKNIDYKTELFGAVTNDHLPVVEYLVKNGADVNSTDNCGCTVLYEAAEKGYLSVVEYLVKSGVDINSVDYDGCTALYGAAKNNHLPVVEYLVKNGAYINNVNEIRETVLNGVVAAGHLLVVEYLVNSGADIHSKDNYNMTLLHEATVQGHLPIVEYLVKSGININSADNFGKTALHEASERGFFQVVEYLVKSKAHINSMDSRGRTALYYAVENGHLLVKDYLIKNNAIDNSIHKSDRAAISKITRGLLGDFLRKHFDYKTSPLPDFDVSQNKGDEEFEFYVSNGVYVNSSHKYGINALHIAAKKGNLSFVQYVVQIGADINFAENGDKTALHTAAQEGHLPVVKFLVENGADLNFTDNDGTQALHAAAKAGHLPVVKFLVKTGDNINISDYNGNTALHVAAREGHLLVVKFLLIHGAIMNTDDKYGSNALHEAAYGGHLPVVEYLVENGSHINSVDKYETNALHSAAEKGHLSVVEYFVKNGANVNSKNKSGRTALFIAADHGHLPVVDYLVKRGVDINIADKNNMTPLSVSASGGHLPVVIKLIENGANVNFVDCFGFTALHSAAEGGFLLVVKYLVESGASMNFLDGVIYTVLDIAAYNDNLPVVEYLIESGADINSVDDNGQTAFYTAAQEGHLLVADFLFKNGSNIHSIDIDGCTALYRAAQYGHLPVVEYLVKNGVNISATDNDGCTALYGAAQDGHLHIVEFLVKNDADITSIDNDGCTSLYIAAQEAHLSVVKYLIESGADINSVGNDGQTALYAAAQKGHLSIVEYLVKSGANLNSIINSGCTALFAAAKESYLPVIEFLVKSGADIHYVDNDGGTVLHYAANKGHLPVVEYFIKQGTDLHSKDIYGCTALYGAAENGYLPVVQSLIKNGANVKCKDDDGCTALYKAVLNGHLEVVLNLVESGTDIKSMNNNGCTVLYGAAEGGHLSVLEYLVRNGADINSKDNYDRTPLFYASYGGHLSAVEYLVNSGASISAVDINGCTVLNPATQEGHQTVVEYFIKNGANVNSKDNDGRTVLHYAAYRGHLQILEHLVESGADIDSIDNSGYTGLYPAALEGHLPVVKFFVSSGADINGKGYNNRTAVHKTAVECHLPVVEYLLSPDLIGRDNDVQLHEEAAQGPLPVIEYLVSSSANVNGTDNYGKTALIGAAEEGHLPVVEYLVSNSADINGTDNNGKTALHGAAAEGHLPVVKYLINNSADVNGIDNYGKTTLHGAAAKGHLPVVRCLFNNSVDINSIDNDGKTALHSAAKEGHLPVVEYLVNSGADINCTSIYYNHGKTALHVAAVEGHLPVVEYLVSNSADINGTDDDGKTALHSAAIGGHLPVIEYLVNIGADINCTDNYGETALRAAEVKGHLPIVEYLLQYVMDSYRADKWKRTTLVSRWGGRHMDCVLLDSEVNVNANEGITLGYILLLLLLFNLFLHIFGLTYF